MQIIEVKNQLVSTIALIDDENKILIGRRPFGKAFENLWEFPGGKVYMGIIRNFLIFKKNN